MTFRSTGNCRSRGGHEMVRREGGLPGEKVCAGCNHYEVTHPPTEEDIREAILLDERHIAAVTDTAFGEAERVHDWRNHIPEDIQRLWPHLSLETRLVAYYMARELASAEEWE